MDVLIVSLILFLLFAFLFVLFVYPYRKFWTTQFGVFTAVVALIVSILLSNGVLTPVALIPIAIVWEWLRRNDVKVKREVADATARSRANHSQGEEE